MTSEIIWSHVKLTFHLIPPLAKHSWGQHASFTMKLKYFPLATVSDSKGGGFDGWVQGSVHWRQWLILIRSAEPGEIALSHSGHRLPKEMWSQESSTQFYSFYFIAFFNNILDKKHLCNMYQRNIIFLKSTFVKKKLTSFIEMFINLFIEWEP